MLSDMGRRDNALNRDTEYVQPDARLSASSAAQDAGPQASILGRKGRQVSLKQTKGPTDGKDGLETRSALWAAHLGSPI